MKTPRFTEVQLFDERFHYTLLGAKLLIFYLVACVDEMLSTWKLVCDAIRAKQPRCS